MNKILFFVIPLLLLSCKKDANIKIKESPKQLVVEAFFSSDPAESYVIVTESEGFKYNELTAFKKITDAQVTITDENGQIINFYTDSEGIFRTSIAGIPGVKYKLKVEADGKTVTAEQTMLPLIEITSFDENEYVRANSLLNIGFDDPENEIDYYKLELEVNVEQGSETYYKNKYLFADYELYNKETNSAQLIFLNGGYAHIEKVKLFHIHKGFYEFNGTLEKIYNENYGDSFFETSVPGNPEMNIKGGIGYFEVAPVSIYTVRFLN